MNACAWMNTRAKFKIVVKLFGHDKKSFGQQLDDIYLSVLGVSELSHEELFPAAVDIPTKVGGSVLCRLIGVVLLDSSLTSKVQG